MRDVIRKVLGLDDDDREAAGGGTTSAPPAPVAAHVEPPAAEPAAAPAAVLPTTPSANAMVPRAILDAIAENAAEIVLHLDPFLDITEVSNGGLRFAGFLESQIVGQPLHRFVHPEDIEFVRAAVEVAFATGRTNVVFRLLAANGQEVWLKSSLARYALDGGIGRVAVIGHDISEQRAVEERLRHMATRDPLTGLANRALLSEKISQLVAQGKRSGEGFAVLMLDLDGFKKVNDTLGHGVGDDLIRAVAKRIEEVVRDTDMVARQGGDEFVCLLSGASDPTAVEIVASRLLGAIQWPFELGDCTLHMTTSIGAAMFPMHGTDEATLLKHADRAMYRAKEGGRNGWALFSSDLEPGPGRTLSLESAMHDAIAAGEFVLHYQPINSIEGRLVGCEALMRWQRPDHSMVPPSEFIPLAESNGLIKILGGWAIRSVCAQLVQWGASAPPDFYASVNVSPRQFRQANFVKVVRQALDLTGLAPARLVIEITEGVLMQNPQASQKIVNELHELGVRIAVDDFGTGYSSLAYLKNFPLSAIKIDRSFVKDVAQGRKDAAIVAAVITLARDLGMDVVAEGVETEEQRAVLADKGCPFVQGWLFGRGQEAHAFQAAHLVSARRLAVAA
jgi:diguanylate cyclase (GGDEF)-like protein/PAS domain S-box-containing protein